MWQVVSAAEAVRPEASGQRAAHLGHQFLQVCRQLVRFSGPHGAERPGGIAAVQAEVHGWVVRRMEPELPVRLWRLHPVLHAALQSAWRLPMRCA